VRWLEVVEAAAGHGLAGLAGSSPDVGVVGYTLGGGLSFLGRKYGLAASHVQAIEVVTADGQLVRADRQREYDLFWALRGGGSFGIVTAIEFRLFPVTQMYAGHLWYPIERGPEVLHAWRELTQGDVPEELTTVGRVLNFPPIPDVPEDVRSRSFVVVEAYYLGDPGQADELLASLRALGPVNGTITSVPMSAISHLHMDPEHPVPYAGEGLLLADLPAAAVNTLTEVAGPGAAFPLPKVEVRHLGGELARPWPGHGALASLDAQYLLHAVGAASGPDAAAAVQGQATAITTALAPWAAPTMYLNFAERPARPRRCGPKTPATGCAGSRQKWTPATSSVPTTPSARQRDRPCRPGCARSRRSGVVDWWYRLPVRACRCGGSGCPVLRCRRWEIPRRHRAALVLLP